MTISELRRLLYAIKKERGDIEVFVKVASGQFGISDTVRVCGEQERLGYPCYIVADGEPDFRGWKTQITYTPTKRGAKRRIILP